MQIELLPYDGFLKRLNDLLPNTHSIEGTTAFWTLDEDFDQEFLWGNLKRILANEESYICCDVSTIATNIESLDTLARYGCNFYVYSYKLSRLTENHPPTLLHSKILLLKLKNGQCIIFMGSHNMTRRALRGGNTEHTLMIECDSNTPLLSDIEHSLYDIKNDCIQYDSQFKHVFKWLQDGIEIEDQLFVSMLFVCVPETSFYRINETIVFTFISFDSLEINHEKVKDLKERDSLINLFIFTKSGKIQIFESQLIETGTTKVDIESTKTFSDGTDFLGIWNRSLSHYFESPIVCHPTSNVSSSIYDIDNTHNYKIIIRRKLETTYKVKNGFKLKTSAWQKVDSIDTMDYKAESITSGYLNKRIGFEFEEVDYKNPDKKISTELKYLKVNKEIFRVDFKDRLIERNSDALIEIKKEGLINLLSSEFEATLNNFNEIYHIIFETLGSENKLDIIKNIINTYFPEYIKALNLSDEKNQKDYFNYKRIIYFRNNLNDKYVNK
jgi:hypothetical protein